MKEFVEVTMDFSMKDIERKNNGFSYIIKWVDGKDMEVNSPTVQFITEGIAEAMFTINGLLTLHPNTKSFNVKRR